MEKSPKGRFRISVDTGGTFTDVVISDSIGNMSVGKAFTTADRIFAGLHESINKADAYWGLGFEQILQKTDVIVYGTTHATNAVVTGKTAKTALLITEGFEDTLTYREGGRIGAFNARASYPGPYVPRRLTFGVPERITAEGEVLEPLDKRALERIIETLRAEEIESVGVMLLWAITNPIHEELIGEMLDAQLPGIPYSLSHMVNPIMREYRRASSAVIDASLKPMMRAHFNGLAADLETAGFRGQFLVVTSEGGVQDIQSLASKPLLAVNSGPSMAPLAGASFAPDAETVVVCDIGGTTFDVSLVEHGRLRYTRELWLGERYTGELTGLASVAVKSVGAGGGSIASLDSGGLLKVGPQSAGSNPGPASYGLGGEEATITDAALVLGMLDPKAFGGDFELNASLAETAVLRKVGTPLGMSALAASTAIIKVASTRSASAAQQAILEEGVDPRGAVIVACGGAGPLLGCFVAEELEADRVVIPANAGVLAAYGAHNADILTEFTVAVPMASHSPDFTRLTEAVSRINGSCQAFCNRFGVSVGDGGVVEYFVEARYPGQGWEIRVPLGEGFDGSTDSFSDAVNAFHTEHEKRNGTNNPASHVEFLAWGARVSIHREPRKKTLTQVRSSGTSVPPVKGMVAFNGTPQETPRYDGGRLVPGWQAEGPIIVDEPTTTIVVPPAWRISLMRDGSYQLDRSAEVNDG